LPLRSRSNDLNDRRPILGNPESTPAEQPLNVVEDEGLQRERCPRSAVRRRATCQDW
jgi:hypothetical protein